jgi:di/tricarboxylate transporter
MDRILVGAIAAGMVALFVSGRMPVDLVAIAVLVVLAGSGILTPGEALSGFASTATVTVFAMMVLSGALERTGATARIAGGLEVVSARAGTRRSLALLVLLSVALSAFINNTAVVTLLIPVAMRLSARSGVSPSRLLIPLSYASIFGGTITLIGTSTNLVVDSMARRGGAPGFRMFDFAPLGLVFAGAGLAYLLVATRFLPARRQQEKPLTLDAEGYTSELVVGEASPLLGKTLVDTGFEKRHEVEVVELLRGSRREMLPAAEPLEEGDVLVVRGPAQAILELQQTAGLALASGEVAGEVHGDGDTVLAEALVSPISAVRGRTPGQLHFRQRYGMTILALQRRGETLRGKLAERALQVGDMLLLQGRRSRLSDMARERDFLVLGERAFELRRANKLWISLAVLALVVLLPVLDIAPIEISALAGVVLVVLLGSLRMHEIYQAVDWQVIFLLAGLIPLGTALEKTGLVADIAHWISGHAGSLGPLAVLSAFYLLTSLTTELMSNVATAILMTPIAMATAADLGVDSRPFLFAIAFAASASFMTPFGYQTNLLVLNPGGYRYTDFLKVGVPLNVLFWVIATFLIPVFWPFTPAT